MLNIEGLNVSSLMLPETYLRNKLLGPISESYSMFSSQRYGYVTRISCQRQAKSRSHFDCDIAINLAWPGQLRNSKVKLRWAVDGWREGGMRVLP